MSEIFSKILKDKNGKVLNVGSQYQQPDWGVDTTTIVDILPETTFEASEDTGGMAPITNPLLYDLVGGNTYEVRYNGSSYSCVCFNFSDGREGSGQLYLGNAAAAGNEDAPATDEPFVVAIFYGTSLEENGVPGMVIPLDGSATFTLSIRGASNEMHAIPAKYVEHAPVAPLLVTVVRLSASDLSVSILDTTFSDIAKAINSGRIVYFRPKNGEELYALTYYNGTYAAFGSINIGSVSATEVQYIVYEVSERLLSEDGGLVTVARRTPIAIIQT